MKKAFGERVEETLREASEEEVEARAKGGSVPSKKELEDQKWDLVALGSWCAWSGGGVRSQEERRRRRRCAYGDLGLHTHAQ